MSKNLLGGGNEDEIRITAPPLSLSITRSSSVFTQVTVNNYGLLCPAVGTYDGTNVFFRPHRDNGTAIANLEYLQGRAGVCPLPASGSWWVNCQTNIAAGVSRMVLYDMPSLNAMLALMTALANTNGNVRVMSAPAGVAIGAASAAIVAANSVRSTVFISHTGTTNGTVATNSLLYLGFGAPAVVGSGICLTPGMTLPFDVLDGITTQAINGISTSGNIQVGVQEGI